WLLGDDGSREPPGRERHRRAGHGATRDPLQDVTPIHTRPPHGRAVLPGSRLIQLPFDRRYGLAGAFVVGTDLEGPLELFEGLREHVEGYVGEIGRASCRGRGWR